VDDGLAGLVLPDADADDAGLVEPLVRVLLHRGDGLVEVRRLGTGRALTRRRRERKGDY